MDKLINCETLMNKTGFMKRKTCPGKEWVTLNMNMTECVDN